MLENTPASALKNRRPEKSLPLFLAVVVFVSIVIPAVISGGMLIRENYQRTIEHDSLAAAKNYADLLEAGMTIPLWNVASDLGKPLVDSVAVDSAVLSVVVVTDKNEPFLQYLRDQDGSQPPESVTLTREIIYEGETLGQVELTYSLALAQARAANETRSLAIITFLQLLFSLATITVVLHRRVLSPLQKLARAAAGIAQGDLRTTIPALKEDEFGVLSRQLETMRGALEENFTQLEKRVEIRTAEIESVNKALRGTLEQLQHAQDHLVQSEKLAALGSLVAGVAHELNTPIGNGLTVATAMCESSSDIKKKMSDGLTRVALERYLADMDEGAHLVHRNLEKASELVSSFKQVAVDRTSMQRRRFFLKELLQETRLTVSPAFKRTPYLVEIDVDDDIELTSYPGPLGQVITNLLNNSLIHGFDKRDHGRVLLTSKVVQDGIELAIQDDGVGIPEEHRDKIFDPFFTTKLGAGGNGLGMHIVHNIVTGVLGGKITLTSEVGKGTCFTLFLPPFAPSDKGQENEPDRAYRSGLVRSAD